MSSPTTLKQQLAIGDMLSLDDELLGFELDIADLMPEPTTLKRRRRTGESEDAYHKRRRNSNVCGQAKRRETLNDHIKVRAVPQSPPGDCQCRCWGRRCMSFLARAWWARGTNALCSKGLPHNSLNMAA